MKDLKLIHSTHKRDIAAVPGRHVARSGGDSYREAGCLIHQPEGDSRWRTKHELEVYFIIGHPVESES